MKTQCPKCKFVFNIPSEYTDNQVKCRRCNNSFKPEKFHKPVIVIPNLPSTGNFITKIWSKSPIAFKTGFLATLGVLSALLLFYHFTGIFRNRTLTQSYYPMDTVSDYYYESTSSIRGEGLKLQTLCQLLGELEMAANLKGFLSEQSRGKIIARLQSNIKFYLNSEYIPLSFDEAKIALRKATEAEIAVLNHEKEHPEIQQNGKWFYDKKYRGLMNKSIELRSEAWSEIHKLTSKI